MGWPSWLRRGCMPGTSWKLTMFLAVWLCTGIAVSIVTFFVLLAKAKHNQTVVCIERCVNRAKAYQNELYSSFETVNMYSGLVKAYPNVSSEDFQTYANATNTLIPSSQGVTYVRHILGPDRAAAEVQLGTGFKQYGTLSEGANPTFVPRVQAPEYYITWRSSLPQYERLFAGYDTLSNARLAAVANLARDKGDLAVTYPFPSVLGTTAVGMYNPLYSGLPVDPESATLEQLRQGLSGFIVAIFNATALFDTANSRFQTQLASLKLFDISGTPNLGPQPSLMYQFPAVFQPPLGYRFGSSYTYTLGSRTYRLDCTADASVRAVLGGPISWGGVLLLVFLAIGLSVFVVAKWLQQKKAEVHRIEKLNKEFEAARFKAESADKAKSAFLATMSHELRTPLTGTLGMLDLLRLTPMTEVQSLYVTTMQNSAESLLGCLNDILDFSKIEAGQLRLEEIDLDIAAVVHRVVALFSGKLLEKGLRIEVELPQGEDCAAKGDPLRLQQVLSNLLSNAIKFTHNGGIAVRWRRLHHQPIGNGASELQGPDNKGAVVVDIEEPRDAARAHCLETVLRKRKSQARAGASVGTSDDERGAIYGSQAQLAEIDGGKVPSAPGDGPEWYEFSVSDTGVGIPPEAQRNLFKSFVQADDSTTRMYGGTGLGLVICKKLVEAMGGTITVQSELNKGTTFTCTVRLQRRSSLLARTPSQSPDMPFSPRPLPIQPEDLIRLSPRGPLEPRAIPPTAELAPESPQPRTVVKDSQVTREKGAQLDAAEESTAGSAEQSESEGVVEGAETRHGQSSETVLPNGGDGALGGTSKQRIMDKFLTGVVSELKGSGASADGPKVQSSAAQENKKEMCTNRNEQYLGGVGASVSGAESGLNTQRINAERRALGGQTDSWGGPHRGPTAGLRVEVERPDEISEVSSTPASAVLGSSESGFSQNGSGLSGYESGSFGGGVSTSSEKEPAYGAHTRARILVAEDNVVNQLLIKKMLRHHGHEVDIVGNGRLAVDAVQAKTYTLCLMDLQMPVLDGIHATEEIRRLDGPSSKVPIYILSADVLAQNKLRDLRINGFLTKPIKWECVFAVISEQLKVPSGATEGR